MAYIRHIPPSGARGRLAEVYEEIRTEVSRVPNLMQVFSLRPETMEGVYRTWLSLMWSGRVSRATKELLAVSVAKAESCDYCVDAHMIFLQAAGMDRDKAYEVELLLADAEGLSPAEKAAVRFAARVTREPRALAASDRVLLAKAWPAIEERVEIISTIAAFNTVTRVANSLGVSLEIPQVVRRFNTTRKGAISLLSRLTALSLDLAEKSLPARSPEENTAALTELFRSQLGFDGIPPGFELLNTCPEFFDGHLRLLEKSVAMVPRDRWMRSGLVVGRLSGCDYLSINCSDWLAHRGDEGSEVIAASEGATTGLPKVEEACLRFVRDVTLHSHTINKKRIEELRCLGMSDGAILDTAFVASIFNGVSSLVLSLAPF